MTGLGSGVIPALPLPTGPEHTQKLLDHLTLTVVAHHGMGSDLIFGFSFGLNRKCVMFTLTWRESVRVLDFTVHEADFIYDHTSRSLM